MGVGRQLVACRVIVRGRVQGVWYRDSCRRMAQSLGVSGWARNRPDGTVEVHAEGSEAEVAQLVSWCRIGPARAEVTGIEVGEVPATGHLGFQVR